MRPFAHLLHAALLLVISTITWTSRAAQAPPPAAAAPSSAQACHAVSQAACETAHALGRGINLGNMLEAPHEGDWGVRAQPALLVLAAGASILTAVEERQRNEIHHEHERGRLRAQRQHQGKRDHRGSKKFRERVHCRTNSMRR